VHARIASDGGLPPRHYGNSRYTHINVHLLLTHRHSLNGGVGWQSARGPPATRLKGPNAFWSARWKKGYNPDLSMVSLDDDGIPYPAERSIVGSFPNSQQKVIVINTGFNLRLNSSLLVPVFDFKKAKTLIKQKP